MVVVTAAFFLGARDKPRAGFFIVILADVGLAVFLMRTRVGLQGVEVVAFSNEFLVRAAKHVGEPIERLARGEGPYGAVPFAGAGAVRAKRRVAALGGRDAARCVEAIRIG